MSTTSREDRTESRLSFGDAAESDRGNFTCSPSNAAPATVQLFVTNKSNHHDFSPLPTRICFKDKNISTNTLDGRLLGKGENRLSVGNAAGNSLCQRINGNFGVRRWRLDATYLSPCIVVISQTRSLHPGHCRLEVTAVIAQSVFHQLPIKQQSNFRWPLLFGF